MLSSRECAMLLDSNSIVLHAPAVLLVPGVKRKSKSKKV